MVVRANGLNGRQHVRRAIQVLGLAMLLTVLAGILLTSSGALAARLSDTTSGLAHATAVPGTPIPTDTPTPTVTYTPTNTPGPCDPRWSVVNSPNATNYDYLYGVAAISDNDVWAVGYYYNGNIGQTLVEHWDSITWSVVPSPNVGTNGNVLNGVVALSDNDVWAVGYYYNGSRYQTLIEHWDGTSWLVVPSPNAGTGSNFLRAVAAVSSNDVWAVGSYCQSGCGPAYTLIEHWNGTQWSVVPSPNSCCDYYLYGVAAVSANDVWAVGYYYDSHLGYWQTLVEHWDGSLWSVVPSPNWGPSFVHNNQLYGVAAVSANDVWAVGYWDGYGGGALTMHWDGTAWSLVTAPSGGTLQGVVAISTYDVWAVGYYDNGGPYYQPMVEHWNGAWSVVSSPNVPSFSNYLNGVAAVSANDVWTVGYLFDRNSSYQTLTEHYATLCGTPTNTPTITLTPTPSVTPTVTNTPTNTRIPTNTGTPTFTYTPAPTYTPSLTPTSCGNDPCTSTPTPSDSTINGHLTWQGVAAANRPLVTGTLILCVSGSSQSFSFTTDTSGNFTITTGLFDGTYHWQMRGGRHITSASPTDGTDLTVTSGHATQEFSTQRAGNTNTDNIVSSTDFSALKNGFGQNGLRPSDFDYNLVVNATDFNILKGNFGHAGSAITCP